MFNDILSQLHPRNVSLAIKQIDQAPESYSLPREESTYRVLWTLACVCVCLLLIHYLKYSSTFVAALNLLSGWAGEPQRHYLNLLNNTGYLELFGYVWWTGWHLVGYVLLPVLLIKWVFKTPLREMGLGINETAQHWLGYLLLLTPILFFVYLVSFRSDFLSHYPFYKQATRSWFDLFAWEVLYLLQFASLEFFFRGFILNALRPAMGASAIWVMCVPYLMIHFPKLWLEATGAILFGFFLGILALRSRSIWGGFMVHAGVAVSMDIVSLVTQGRLPTRWWH